MPFWMQLIRDVKNFLTGLRWYVYGFAFFFAFGVIFGGCVCSKFRDVVGEPSGDIGGMGWVDDKAAVQQVLAGLPRPLFSQSAAFVAQDTPDQDALLYLAAKKVTGALLPAHDQNGTGCCVGEGTAGAVNLLQCIEIAKGEQQEFKPVSAAASYAMAREIGGMLRGGDGAVVAYSVKAATQWGTVSCEDAKDDNTNPGPHARLAKQWGRSGLPDNLKEIARKTLVKGTARCADAEEVRVALTNGYPVVFGSNVGFQGGGGFKRDTDGFCKRGGTWAHCMYVAGYRQDKRAFCIIQSWGPRTPPGPTTLDQPSCSFWITWADMNTICRTGEAFALSTFDGFPSQKFDWLVQVTPRREDLLLARLDFRFALAP